MKEIMWMVAERTLNVLTNAATRVVEAEELLHEE